jgi:predicted metalloprotease with PDZ domain
MRLHFASIALLFSLQPPIALAEMTVAYSVAPSAAGPSGVSSRLHMTITLPADVPAGRLTLIMPRAIPMGYGQQPYDEFVRVTLARSRSGAPVAITREDGPRWSIQSESPEDRVAGIEYDVDLAAMESAVLSGGDSSRSRDGYMSLLGYSIFAYVDGLEDRGIELGVLPPPDREDWPVFSTLSPMSPATRGPLSARAADFYGLADSQVLIGPGFRVRKLQGSPDLFLALRAEGPSDEDVMAPLAEEAFEALVRYFGSAPFPHYTLVFEYLKPVSPRHTYGFSMEHLQSATFGAAATAALTSAATDRVRASFRYNVAHHISHAWIPKRCAGEGYFPFRFELAPLIDTIWLSEGFGQYAAADALSDVLPPSATGQSYRDALVDLRFRSALREMPDFLKRMPLLELSRVASTVYSEDFRTGRTVFSRGGLMAYEMDEKIRVSTNGSKRLRDALRGLVAWSAREKRPFRIDELPAIFKTATGVETAGVMERWLLGMK